MKLLPVVMLIMSTATTLAFDCKVTCPQGYKGASVKSDSGCDCTCDKEASKAKEDILNALRAAGASDEFLSRVQELLAVTDELPNTTLTDSKTGKTFTISLKTQK